VHSCQLCGAPATVHLTDIINKKKRETHLCEPCARAQNIIPSTNEPQLNIAGLIQALMQQTFGPYGTSSTSEDTADPHAIVCPDCGLKYAQFRADGRLGCPKDYDTYQSVLTPLLERVHRSLTHCGKTPQTVRRDQHRDLRQRELDDLRRRLTDAVATENYEEAARIRDCLRQKETAG
jgi:protein arginine kinase activator